MNATLPEPANDARRPTSMGAWRRWCQAPQTLWWRRALFQVHLWLGISCSLYILLIASSGTALLLKSPFYTWFVPTTLEPLDSEPLRGDALMERMAEVYEGFELGFMMTAYDPEDATYIVLNRDGEYFPHYFNQYTGEDQGSANPWPLKAVEKLADMHDDLLLGPQGRRLNGAGGALLILMSLSGLLLWWRGQARWYQGLIILPRSTRSLWWQLHGFLGFWGMLLMLAWGLSGLQLGFPREFARVVSYLDADPFDGAGLDPLLRFIRSVHFARLGEGEWVRWFWIVLSLLPSMLLVSGTLVWWRRVIRRRRPDTSKR